MSPHIFQKTKIVKLKLKCSLGGKQFSQKWSSENAASMHSKRKNQPALGSLCERAWLLWSRIYDHKRNSPCNPPQFTRDGIQQNRFRHGIHQHVIAMSPHENMRQTSF